MAGTAPVDPSLWLPAYGWWPPVAEYDATVVLTPYHAAVEKTARFSFTLRGYSGSNEPAWVHEVGELRHGHDRAIRLSDLDCPPPPDAGGILEVHGIRLDQAPRKGSGFIGMWIDARSSDGGGYIAPTIPIRTQAKAIVRDDVQVVPGVLASAEMDTEILLLNVVGDPTEVRLVVTSVEGLSSESSTFIIDRWSAWRGSVRKLVPRVRPLLAESGGVGSLTIHASHRLLPYFGFRRNGGPILSLDHAAPIFA